MLDLDQGETTWRAWWRKVRVWVTLYLGFQSQVNWWYYKGGRLVTLSQENVGQSSLRALKWGKGHWIHVIKMEHSTCDAVVTGVFGCAPVCVCALGGWTRGGEENLLWAQGWGIIQLWRQKRAKLRRHTGDTWRQLMPWGLSLPQSNSGTPHTPPGTDSTPNSAPKTKGKRGQRERIEGSQQPLYPLITLDLCFQLNGCWRSPSNTLNNHQLFHKT